MDYLHQELEKLNITWQNVTVLQDKDGVTVARVASGGESYVLKCFQNADYRREIQNLPGRSHHRCDCVHGRSASF